MVQDLHPISAVLIPDSQQVPVALAVADHGKGLPVQLGSADGVGKLDLLLVLKHLPERAVDLLEDLQRVAVEGRQGQHFLLAVSVKVQQQRVAGGLVQQLIHGPLSVGGCGRSEAEHALFAGDDAHLYAVLLVAGIAVVLQQALPDHHGGQPVVLGQAFQILRQRAGPDLAREAPVVLILIIALQGAGDQVVDAVSAQHIEAVDARQIQQRFHLPLPVLMPAEDNGGLLVVVGRIHPVGGQEGAVRLRKLHRGHGAAGLLPDLIHKIAVLVKQQAGIGFLGCHQQMALALVLQRGNPVAQGQIGDFFLLSFHGIHLIY